MDLEQKVARLVAIEEIKTLKARYFRLLDTRDWNGWCALFTPECRIYCQADPDAVIVGPDDFVAFVRAGITPGLSVHHGHMPEIEVLDADTASGTWAMADIVRTEGASPRRLAGTGHYHERYERGADGVWRIASLRLTRLVVDTDIAIDASTTTSIPST